MVDGIEAKLGFISTDQANEIVEKYLSNLSRKAQDSINITQNLQNLSTSNYAEYLHLGHPLTLTNYQANKIKALANQAKYFANSQSKDPIEQEKIIATTLANYIADIRGLGLTHNYSPAAKTASEAFKLGEGECRELSYLYVLMAREVGLNAVFLGVTQYEDHQTVYQKGMGHLIAGVILSDMTPLQIDPTAGRLSYHDHVEYFSDADVVAEYLTEEACSIDDSHYSTQQKFSKASSNISPLNFMARYNMLGSLNQNQYLQEIQSLERDFTQDPEALALLALVYNSLGSDLMESAPQDLSQLSNEEKTSYLQAYQFLQKALRLSQKAIHLEKPGIHTLATIIKSHTLIWLSHFEKVPTQTGNEIILETISTDTAYLKLQQTQEILNELMDALHHDVYNPKDREYMRKGLAQIKSVIQTSEINHDTIVDKGFYWHGQKISWKELKENWLEQFQKNTELALDQYPKTIRWFLNNGDWELAENYIFEAKRINETTKKDVGLDLNLQYLHGDYYYLQSRTDQASSRWNREPYRQDILNYFLDEMAYYIDPNNTEHGKAKMLAEKILLLDPNNQQAIQYLIMWYANYGYADEVTNLLEKVTPENQTFYQLASNFELHDLKDKAAFNKIISTIANSTTTFKQDHLSTILHLANSLLVNQKAKEFRLLFEAILSTEDGESFFDNERVFTQPGLAQIFWSMALHLLHQESPKPSSLKAAIAIKFLEVINPENYINMNTKEFLQDAFENDVWFAKTNSYYFIYNKGKIPSKNPWQHLGLLIDVTLELDNVYAKHPDLEPDIRPRENRIKAIKQHPEFAKFKKGYPEVADMFE